MIIPAPYVLVNNCVLRLTCVIQGNDCVPWPTCQDGVINTSGAGLFDLRGGVGEPPESVSGEAVRIPCEG